MFGKTHSEMLAMVIYMGLLSSQNSSASMPVNDIQSNSIKYDTMKAHISRPHFNNQIYYTKLFIFSSHRKPWLEKPFLYSLNFLPITARLVPKESWFVGVSRQRITCRKSVWHYTYTIRTGLWAKLQWETRTTSWVVYLLVYLYWFSSCER